MSITSKNSFQSLKELNVGKKKYQYFSLEAASQNGLGSSVEQLPNSLKVLLENQLRFEDGKSVTEKDCKAFVTWLKNGRTSHEIAYRPTRVLMQDFTGVPAVVDLAAMRDAMKDLGHAPEKINPLSPVDLVIDHSVMVDVYGTPDAYEKNMDLEFKRNHERYQLLKWSQDAFNNFHVVPPGTGICHQVNLEYLAKTIWTKQLDHGKILAYPDTVVGTDSHTTMINGLSVLGWGVGGIEAEAAMLDQPVTMMIPEVVGFELTGELLDGITATDLVLTIVQMLRQKGVVGKFVEFFGSGLDHLSLADRATIANMAPEYGATCGFFPIDQETLNYLSLTGRSDEQIELVEAYAKAQGMWRSEEISLKFSDTLSLDLGTVEPSLAGTKRPQDRIALAEADRVFQEALKKQFELNDEEINKKVPVSGKNFSLTHGSIVIAAITSCTNTSNPSVMIAAGLVARKARERGLISKPWVKTSLAPGSQVVADYLENSGLQKYLDELGFNIVGYGCTTCIGNSGPLLPEISQAIHQGQLVACSVLSGNRNFEGRISPDVRANFLASPPLVVAYALVGDMKINIFKDSLGKDAQGKDVYLKDIWPSSQEIKEVINSSVNSNIFKQRYRDVFKGPQRWQQISTSKGLTFTWDPKSTYIKKPPFFEGMSIHPDPRPDIVQARALAILGDSVTTDHISPAGSIAENSPAGQYLLNHGVKKEDFNSYGSRRGNHEVMMRGTFANIRIRNEMLDQVEGGFTRHIPSGEQLSIYDAAMRYAQEHTPLVVIAGKEYGTGSSRDWAAKGTALLGVRAVIAESFERIHRSNLVGMGVLPLEFTGGQTRKTLQLKGDELYNIHGLASLQPRQQLSCEIVRSSGQKENITLQCRIDTVDELQYFQHGGILQYVLRMLCHK